MVEKVYSPFKQFSKSEFWFRNGVLMVVPPGIAKYYFPVIFISSDGTNRTWVMTGRRSGFDIPMYKSAYINDRAGWNYRIRLENGGFRSAIGKKKDAERQIEHIAHLIKDNGLEFTLEFLNAKRIANLNELVRVRPRNQNRTTFADKIGKDLPTVGAGEKVEGRVSE